MSLPLHTHAKVSGVTEVGLYKVLEREEALSGAYPFEGVLIWEGEQSGFPGGVSAADRGGADIQIVAPKDPAVVQPGDVVRVRPGSSMVSVLYRRGSKANTLFATERCNSRCLMCSQPPRDEDDSWRVSELLRLVELVDRNEVQLGISGGEPTLLGEDLGRLIDACEEHLPQTSLHILTNGRAFADRDLTERLAGRNLKSVTWAVPLYADVEDIHDEVVAASGAFGETLLGLFELGRLGARVEIRVVLHRMTVERLPQLASFIYRRLPFVEHVALMGLEPMGYAKANRERLWIDPADYVVPLGDAVFHLTHRGLDVSIYNLPLCILPASLRPFARQSISDWKNDFAPECAGCELTSTCSGFFASAGPAWRSRAVRRFISMETAA